MVLNHNIDNIKCLVRLSHFTHKEEDHDKFHNAYIFGIQSIAGKILTFHIMTDYGMMRSRVPLSDCPLYTSDAADQLPGIHFVFLRLTHLNNLKASVSI